MKFSKGSWKMSCRVCIVYTNQESRLQAAGHIALCFQKYLPFGRPKNNSNNY